MKNPTLILDCETGGLDPLFDSLCSVSVMLVDGSNPKTWYIQPYDKQYQLEAMHINGLTYKKLLEEGVSIDIFAFELLEYCETHFGKENLSKIQLLGHNIPFDISFLKEAIYNLFYMEEDDTELISNFFLNYDDIFDNRNYKDTKVLANFFKDINLIPYKQSTSLKDLYIYFFEEDEISKNAHNSESDIIMTSKIYKKMLKLSEK